MEDLLDGWGLSLAAFLPLVGALVVMAIFTSAISGPLIRWSMRWRHCSKRAPRPA